MGMAITAPSVKGFGVRVTALTTVRTDRGTEAPDD